MINRHELISRHNPVLKTIRYDSPLTVGNGELAYTADITGMQTLYKEYERNQVPLCTMSQWGWHTTPVNENRYSYTMADIEMTTYDYNNRKVNYAVEMKKGNEEAYGWLRKNPHRLNLARIGFIWEDHEIQADEIQAVFQNLTLYEGRIESRFTVHGVPCEVVTACAFESDILGFQVKSPALMNGRLKVRISFPYGHHGITASDWNCTEKHTSSLKICSEKQWHIDRVLDRDQYYVAVQSEEPIAFIHKGAHRFELQSKSDTLSFTAAFSEAFVNEQADVEQVMKSSRNGWKNFWEHCGVVELHKSKDERANELERRIILSQYVSAIQSCGSAPPQETGLTCNSWYGKFHLEMHLWHSAYLPLWNCAELLKKSLPWYRGHLPQARDNAVRNGYKGARWPKMVAYDAVDSPSTIATLLIWQQPHIIYMLELIYKSGEATEFLNEYWDIVKETADFMCDFAFFNKVTQKYDLISPIIPAQEEHNPQETLNPSFEVEYWRFALQIAVEWTKRLGYPSDNWEKVAGNMADLPEKDGLYLAHQNCPATFEAYNRDHPSMLLAFGLIHSDRISHQYMKNTLKKVIDCWDFATMWGWDFAAMAMTAVRLGDPATAVDILLKDTPKNSYVASGNNFQKSRNDLPLYLPGNGSLLLAIPLMTAGYVGCKESLPGFPKNGMWEVEFENISPFPY